MVKYSRSTILFSMPCSSSSQIHVWLEVVSLDRKCPYSLSLLTTHYVKVLSKKNDLPLVIPCSALLPQLWSIPLSHRPRPPASFLHLHMSPSVYQSISHGQGNLQDKELLWDYSSRGIRAHCGMGSVAASGRHGGQDRKFKVHILNHKTRMLCLCVCVSVYGTVHV